MALLLNSSVVFATTEQNTDTQLQSLNLRLQQVEEKMTTNNAKDAQGSRNRVSNNAFNPAISVILDGGYASYKNNTDDYYMPGYIFGGEAELAKEGFSLGHSELTLSNNIDDKFYAKFTIAVAEHDGETEIELEEAFFETLSLGGGVTVRGGRFYSALGYLNQQHQHAWDFKDAPLIYAGLFGNQYFDDGLRLSYIAPTDLYVELGAEVFAGGKYPAGGDHSGAGSWVTFVNLGGDLNISHSWQAGLSYWAADAVERSYDGHEHDGAEETPVFAGDSKVVGVNGVYKWAPNGNNREQNLKLQFEYFQRDEDGEINLEHSNSLETSSLNSKQDGWYAQAAWQFMRSWRTAVRYDRASSNNVGSDIDVLDEVGLLSNAHTPQRSSVMLEWLPSEYSRIRLQYNHDQASVNTDEQVFVQYTFSMGAHGAHQY